MKMEIKNYEDEEKGIYIFGVNIKDFVDKTTSEDRGVLLHKMIKDFQETFDKEVSPQKFKKRGIVFFLPQLEKLYKGFVYFCRKLL